MGFYAPRSLIDDARRHGVSIRPVDVQHSDYDNILERNEAGEWALRMGLRQLKGFKQEAGLRIAVAKHAGAFTTIAELQQRANLNRGDLAVLARANALRSLTRNRRQAMWSVQGLYDLPLFRGLQRTDSVSLPQPTASDELRDDYLSQGFSLSHNPIGMERKRLNAEGFLCAADVMDVAGGRTIKVAGMVAHRQRPSTAKGVVFMTLEDETGLLNVVIKPSTFDRQRKIIVQHNLLEITAKVQRDGNSVSLLAIRFSPIISSASANLISRDFR